MSNMKNLHVRMKQRIIFLAKQMVSPHYANPELSKERFIEATKNIKTADALVSLCLVAAASHSEFRIEEFIREQSLNGDPNFIKALQSIKQNASLYHDGNWSVSNLHFIGQCLLEAGYISDVDCIKKYQNKIGAKSMFSPNYITETASVKAQHIIAKKRARFSQERVVEAGMAMITHMNNLRKKKN